MDSIAIAAVAFLLYRPALRRRSIEDVSFLGTQFEMLFTSLENYGMPSQDQDE